MQAVDNDCEKVNLLCELNVIEQVANVCNTTVLRNAWKSQQEVTVHGLVYNLEDGILKDLEVSANKNSSDLSV
jgi:carbonic anhydrase